MTEGSEGFNPDIAEAYGVGKPPQRLDTPEVQAILDEALRKECPFEIGAKVIANPEHPLHSEDRALVKVTKRDETAIGGVFDGIGSGGEASAEASDLALEVFRRQLGSSVETLDRSPTVNEAVHILEATFIMTGRQVAELEKISGSDQIGTTAVAGLIAKSVNSEDRFLVTGNAGDSRAWIYDVASGEAKRLTREHSLMESLIGAGQITPEETFTHPQRSAIYRSLGDVDSPEKVDITVHPLPPGSVVVFTSDGFHDNIHPKAVGTAFRRAFSEAYDSSINSVDMGRFAGILAQRAANIMNEKKAVQAKNDDISVAAIQYKKVL